jgi:hypothetical protein
MLLSRASGRQRACADGEGGGVNGTGLCAGAAVGCGGPAESLCKISCWSACSLAISPPICPSPVASWAVSRSTLWRTAARPSASCFRSDETAPAGAGAIGTTGAVCGANQPSCGDEFAIMALAASPYDCQAKIVPTPTQKTIKKRASLRNTRLASDGRMMAPSSDDGFIAPTVGLAALGCVGTSDCVGLNVESIGAPPCLLRPAAHCSSSHPNSASRASNVGRSEGESNCFICTVATPYRNPKLVGQLVRTRVTISRRH